MKRGVVSAIVSVLLVVIIGAAIFFTLKFAPNLWKPVDIVNTGTDDWGLAGFLQSKQPLLDFKTTDINVTEIKNILSNVKKPQNMSMTVSIRLKYGGRYGDLQRTASYTKQGATERVSVTDSGGNVLVRAVITAGQLTYTQGSATLTLAKDVTHTPESIMGIADVKYFIAQPSANIIDAKLMDYEGEKIIYIEYRVPELSQTEKYYISIFHGIPIRVQTFHQGNLVYEAVTTSVN